MQARVPDPQSSNDRGTSGGHNLRVSKSTAPFSKLGGPESRRLPPPRFRESNAHTAKPGGSSVSPALATTGPRKHVLAQSGHQLGGSPIRASQGLQCCPGEIGGWHQPSGTIKGTFQLAMLRLSLCSFSSISFPACSPVESSKMVY